MKFQGQEDEFMQMEVKRIHEKVVARYLQNSSTPKSTKLFLDSLERELTVILNRRMRSNAGMAYFRQLKIELHYRAMKANPWELEQTYAHELAHLIAHRLHQDAGHGEGWHLVMEQMGYPAEQFHTIDVSRWQPRQHLFSCDCGVRRIPGHVRHAFDAALCERCTRSFQYIGREMSNDRVRDLLRAAG